MEFLVRETWESNGCDFFNSSNAKQISGLLSKLKNNQRNAVELSRKTYALISSKTKNLRLYFNPTKGLKWRDFASFGSSLIRIERMGNTMELHSEIYFSMLAKWRSGDIPQPQEGLKNRREFWHSRLFYLIFPDYFIWFPETRDYIRLCGEFRTNFNGVSLKRWRLEEIVPSTHTTSF